MTHDESYIEILISKHLDGEISTSEQRHLQETLDQDPQTRQLFEELKELHEISQTAVDNTLSQGRPAEDILGAALQPGPQDHLVGPSPAPLLFSIHHRPGRRTPDRPVRTDDQ